MAAALLKVRLVRDKDRRQWDVWSAGTWARTGQPASEYAVEEMAERGLNIMAHRSQPVTIELMEKADLILVAAQGHVEALTGRFPRHAARIRLLSAMAGGCHDIHDPYGGTRAEYAYVAAELETLIETGYECIVALAEEEASSRILDQA
jgi:protein-tyrosine-phosphatase